MVPVQMVFILKNYNIGSAAIFHSIYPVSIKREKGFEIVQLRGRASTLTSVSDMSAISLHLNSLQFFSSKFQNFFGRVSFLFGRSLVRFEMEWSPRDEEELEDGLNMEEHRPRDSSTSDVTGRDQVTTNQRTVIGPKEDTPKGRSWSVSRLTLRLFCLTRPSNTPNRAAQKGTPVEEGKNDPSPTNGDQIPGRPSTNGKAQSLLKIFWSVATIPLSRLALK